MSHPEELKRLNAEVSSYLGHLSKSQLWVLSLYVLGVVVMHHCGQTRVAAFLAEILGAKVGTVKQRLRELTYAADAKQGEGRLALEVETCFGPLLGWVLAKFPAWQRELVLACDATYLQDRFTILSVSVVLAGCAIPVAWHIQGGSEKGEWNPIWLRLLSHLHARVPPDWRVFVLTDSGLYSKTLFRAIQATFHWHPLMRINAHSGLFLAHAGNTWQKLSQMVYKGMTPVCMAGKCFKGNPLTATLIARWDADYDKPCLLVTDLHPTEADQNIYSIRYWIEAGFKDVKRGELHWEQTKMTCPKRAERLWLVISIALLWLICIGEAAADQPQWQSLTNSPNQRPALSRPVLGWITIIVALFKRQPLPFGYLKSYPWLIPPQQLNTYP